MFDINSTDRSADVCAGKKLIKTQAIYRRSICLLINSSPACPIHWLDRAMPTDGDLPME